MMMHKQLSSPYSTGSGGVFFESRVQAALVSLMLAKGVCPCLPEWTIYKIQLQGRYSGFATDDVIVFTKDERSDQEAKLIAQIKRAPAITTSDPQFADVIHAAWKDFNNPAVLSSDYDALALITGPLTSSDTYDVRDMLEIARKSQNSADFFHKIDLVKFSSRTKREKLKVFEHHIRNANNGMAPDRDTTWNFLRRFHLLGFDLDIENGFSLSTLHSLIRKASTDLADVVWPKIVKEVQARNQCAGVLTLSNLPKDLLDHFRVTAPPPLPVVPPSPVRETIAAALIGAWDENRSGDRALIEDFTRMSFVQWQDKIRDVWVSCPGLFDQNGGQWRVANRLAFWKQEAPRISDSLLDRFKELAVKVLLECDPSLDLEPAERFATDVQGKVRDHSTLIRKGVSETLALLGAEGNSLSTCSPGKGQGVANICVKKILDSDDWRRWASVNDILPLIAEASPDSFLTAIRDAANSSSAVFERLFAQDRPGITGRTYTTGTLWGLESLAWSSEYLVSVCRILADLAKADPEGNCFHQPLNSLTKILLPWLPQTSGKTNKRHAAVKVVLDRSEAVGWKLVCSLLPLNDAVSSGTHKPIWRKFITAEHKNGVSETQYWEDVFLYSDMALEMAKTNVDRLAVLVDGYFQLPEQSRQKLRARIRSDDVLSLGEDLRFKIWHALNRLTTNHRKFADDRLGKVHEASLEELDAIADLLRPTAPEVKHKRLFCGYDFDLYESTGDLEEQHAKLAGRRKEAVNEVFLAGGRELLLAFTKSVLTPLPVGFAMGSLGEQEHDHWILPALLQSDENSLVQFVCGYVSARHQAAGWQWVDSLSLSDWANSELGPFFTFLPFCEETWKRVESIMAGNEAAYWLNAHVNPFQATAGLEGALQRLVNYGRHDAAIHCMQMMIHSSQPIPMDLAVNALLGLKSNHQLGANAKHVIASVLSYLQEHSPMREDTIERIEWKFIPYLGRFCNGRPVMLSRRLAADPDFFVEVIQALYRSSKSEADFPDPSEEEKSNAIAAFHLLQEWNLPPGTLSDGTFSAEALTEWVTTVKDKCMESAYWNVAAHHIGQVLRYAPVDEHGLWVDSVCRILDQDDHDTMRVGIAMEIYNRRDFIMTDRLKPDSSAAEPWEKLADRAENKGFALVAQELRRLAKDYRDDAHRHARRSSIDVD